MAYRLNTVKILLVEDMHPMLILTRSILDIFGFKNVITAKDGEEAFQKFCYEKPDLVITDWIMDNMNGLELIERIRTDSASPDKYVPIILMTGYSNKGRVETARDCGMTEFLAKPFKARDLYTRIVQIVEKPRKFVKNENFFGPDRRRRKDEDYAGPVRREDDKRQ